MNDFFDRTFCLEVWGDYACFTRPEMKVERVSYDVITPSAARAIFEAIFWKPAIYWKIKKIEVLNPIKWISVRRNETGTIMSEKSNGFFIEDVRQQRAGLFLREVRYRLYADLVFIPPEKRKNTPNPLPDFLIDSEEKQLLCNELTKQQKNENPAKYYGIFERRAKKGQCFNQPYFGCREFSCAFSLITEDSPLPKPISESCDFGFMLYDMDFSDPNDIKPAFFRAKMENGTILIPEWNSDEVRK